MASSLIYATTVAQGRGWFRGRQEEGEGGGGRRAVLADTDASDGAVGKGCEGGARRSKRRKTTKDFFSRDEELGLRVQGSQPSAILRMLFL